MWSHPPATLPQLVEHFAAEKPGDLAYAFLGDGETVTETATYAQLQASSVRVANGLRSLAAPGTRVVLLFPAGLDFLRAFFGAVFGGVVAVPVYPPERSRLDADLARIANIARDCDAELIVCAPEYLELYEEALRRQPDLANRKWVTIDDWRDHAATTKIPAQTNSDALAMLQYTSGSVATPKGVMLTHANLLANQASIREAMAMPDAAVFVSWLPLYHDMGLIGTILQPLYVGGCCYLMSPHHFIQKPSRWLSAISRYRAVVSGGPNFAFELCLNRVPDAARSELDLSSWRVAFCGAEPIRGETLRQFASAYQPYGLRQSAIYPCYGLAESSLLVTGAAPSSGGRHEWFDATSLRAGGSEIVAASTAATELVSAGRPPSNQDVRIVDPQTQACVADGTHGEVWVSGPSVAKGYWGNVAGTEAAFVEASAVGPGRWLRTGDLGFIRAGEVFVVGRLKEAIIIRGRNFMAQDIEHRVQSVSHLFRKSGGAAFGVDVDGEERLVIVQEVARARRHSLHEIGAEAVAGVTADFSVQVHELILVDPKAVPKTRNGKISRTGCRSAYLAGTLPVIGTLKRGALVMSTESVDVS